MRVFKDDEESGRTRGTHPAARAEGSAARPPPRPRRQAARGSVLPSQVTRTPGRPPLSAGHAAPVPHTSLEAPSGTRSLRPQKQPRVPLDPPRHHLYSAIVDSNSSHREYPPEREAHTQLRTVDPSPCAENAQGAGWYLMAEGAAYWLRADESLRQQKEIAFVRHRLIHVCTCVCVCVCVCLER